MENRITISICDEEYTFVAEEAPSYMQKVGSYVNDKMSELLDAAKVGRTDAAVLTAATTPWLQRPSRKASFAAS